MATDFYKKFQEAWKKKLILVVFVVAFILLIAIGQLLNVFDSLKSLFPNNDLTIVDISVIYDDKQKQDILSYLKDQNPGIGNISWYPIIDLKLLNLNDAETIYISEIDFTANKTQSSSTQYLCRTQHPTQLYNIGFNPSKVTNYQKLNVSQILGPNESDRLIFIIGHSLTGWDVEYNVEVSIHYNDSRLKKSKSFKLFIKDPACTESARLIEKYWNYLFKSSGTN